MARSLIANLATYLSVHTVILCMDQDQSSVPLIGLEDQYYYVAYATSNDDVIDLALRHRDAVTMIVCNHLDFDIIHQELLDARTIWLVLYADSTNVQRLPLRLDSFFLTWHLIDGSDDIELVEHYAVKGKYLRGVLGRWSERGGLRIDEPSVWDRRANLNGAELVTTAMTYHPITMVSQRGKALDGLFPELIGILQGSLNFK